MVLVCDPQLFPPLRPIRIPRIPNETNRGVIIKTDQCIQIISTSLSWYTIPSPPNETNTRQGHEDQPARVSAFKYLDVCSILAVVKYVVTVDHVSILVLGLGVGVVMLLLSESGINTRQQESHVFRDWFRSPISAHPTFTRGNHLIAPTIHLPSNSPHTPS